MKKAYIIAALLYGQCLNASLVSILRQIAQRPSPSRIASVLTALHHAEQKSRNEEERQEARDAQHLVEQVANGRLAPWMALGIAKQLR